MYATPQDGQAVVSATAPTLHVGTLRRTLLAVISGNDLFTPAEQLRANHKAHECQDERRLALWLKNVRRVEAERAQAHTLVAVAQGIARFEARVAQASTAYEAAQLAYKKADAASRRLTTRRNNLMAQLHPMRADGFPVYSYAENPNRQRLDAAHQAAKQAAEQEAAAWAHLLATYAAQQQPNPETPTPAPTPALAVQVVRYATPSQCDELYRLACHPALTPAEKAQTLALLPTLTEGAAVAHIGQLYAQVLRRAGQLGWRDGSTLLAA